MIPPTCTYREPASLHARRLGGRVDDGERDETYWSALAGRRPKHVAGIPNGSALRQQARIFLA